MSLSHSAVLHYKFSGEVGHGTKNNLENLGDVLAHCLVTGIFFLFLWEGCIVTFSNILEKPMNAFS